MLGFRKKNDAPSAPFEFRVSDVVDVPLRGIMLRLRVVDGAPALSDLAVGKALELRAPDGTVRQVRIAAHPVTGGKPSQKRLDSTREFDVLLAGDGAADATPVEIGWTATGPVA
jgi:hypothetical protein